MENSLHNTIVTFVEDHYSRIKLVEKISILILLTGLFIYQFERSNYSVLIITGSILTAIIYFILSYEHVEAKNLETTSILNSIGFINFIYKLTFYSLAFGYLAMPGLILNFKSENPIMKIVSITLIATLIISLIARLDDRTEIYNFAFYIRILIMLIFLLFLRYYNQPVSNNVYKPMVEVGLRKLVLLVSLW